MKNFYILFLISFTILSCTKKPGVITGNVYWKYNNYVGNKPDSGARIKLISFDKTQKDSIFETKADVSGNYSISEIPPGKYFLIIESENTTDSPTEHLENIKFWSKDLKELFGLDLQLYSKEIAEIKKVNQQYDDVLMDSNLDKYGGISKKIELYQTLEKSAIDKSEILIDKIPNKIRYKIGLLSGYSKSLDFQIVQINEGKSKNIITDFGTTYM
jgi:hypothetical protein